MATTCATPSKKRSVTEAGIATIPVTPKKPSKKTCAIPKTPKKTRATPKKKTTTTTPRQPTFPCRRSCTQVKNAKRIKRRQQANQAKKNFKLVLDELTSRARVERTQLEVLKLEIRIRELNLERLRLLDKMSHQAKLDETEAHIRAMQLKRLGVVGKFADAQKERAIEGRELNAMAKEQATRDDAFNEASYKKKEAKAEEEAAKKAEAAKPFGGTNFDDFLNKSTTATAGTTEFFETNTKTAAAAPPGSSTPNFFDPASTAGTAAAAATTTSGATGGGGENLFMNKAKADRWAKNGTTAGFTFSKPPPAAIPPSPIPPSGSSNTGDGFSVEMTPQSKGIRDKVDRKGQYKATPSSKAARQNTASRIADGKRAEKLHEKRNPKKLDSYNIGDVVHFRGVEECIIDLVYFDPDGILEGDFYDVSVLSGSRKGTKLIKLRSDKLWTRAKKPEDSDDDASDDDDL